MSESDKDAVNVRIWPLAAWLQLTIVVALVLVLAGCGTGSSSENSGQDETDGNGQSTGQTRDQSTPETTAKPGTKPKEAAESTQQASGGDGELGTPALGDPGAPVVMVEYSDYQ